MGSLSLQIYRRLVDYLNPSPNYSMVVMARITGKRHRFEVSFFLTGEALLNDGVVLVRRGGASNHFRRAINGIIPSGCVVRAGSAAIAPRARYEKSSVYLIASAIIFFCCGFLVAALSVDTAASVVLRGYQAKQRTVTFLDGLGDRVGSVAVLNTTVHVSGAGGT